MFPVKLFYPKFVLSEYEELYKLYVQMFVTSKMNAFVEDSNKIFQAERTCVYNLAKK